MNDITINMIIIMVIGSLSLIYLVFVLNQYSISKLDDIEKRVIASSCTMLGSSNDKSSIRLPDAIYSGGRALYINYCYREAVGFSKIRHVFGSTYEFVLERGAQANITLAIDGKDVYYLERYINNPKLDEIHLYRYERGWVEYKYDWYNGSGVKIYQSYSEVYPSYSKTGRLIVTYTFEADDNARYATYEVKTSIIPYMKIFLTIPFEP